MEPGCGDLIRLSNVEKCFAFGAGLFHALRRVDLHVSQGECVTLMGPSGAGKTTPLNILGVLRAKDRS